MTGKRQTWHSTHMKTRLYSVFMKYSAQSVWGDQLILTSNLWFPWWWSLVPNTTEPEMFISSNIYSNRTRRM
jgi:hypothetical protein